MKIKRIETNAKGRTLKLDLDAVNVVVGDNFSGKTAVLDSLMIGLLGHHPRLGKTNSAAMKLAGAGHLKVTLKTDEATITREWKTEKGKVKYVGDDPKEFSVPNVLLDAREYFSMSTQDRLKYVFSRIDLQDQGSSAEAITAEIKKLPVKDPTEATEKAVAEIVQMVQGSAEDRDDTGQTWQEWVDELIDDMKERKKQADAAAKSFAGFANTQTQLEGEEEPPENIDAKLKEVKKRYEEKLGEVKALNAKIAQDRKTLKKRMEIEAELGATEDPGPREVENLEAEIKSMEAKVDQYEPQAQKLESDQWHLTKTITQLQDSERDLKGKLGQDKCPYCGADEPGWQDKLKVELEDVRSKLVAAEKESVRLEKAVQQAKKADEQHRQDKVSLQNMRRNLSALQKIRTDQESLTKQLANLPEVDEESLSSQEETLTAAKAKLEDIQNEHEALDVMKNKALAAKQDRLRREQARQKAAEIEADREVSKLAVQALQDIRERVVDRAFGVILGRANLFCEGILPSTLQYRDGEIGQWQDKTWVGHETFSGTEQAVAFAGLAVALAQESPIKIVLMDEMGRMDRATKGRFLDRMKDLAHDGTVDQFVGVDVEKPDVEVPGKKSGGVKVIEL